MSKMKRHIKAIKKARALNEVKVDHSALIGYDKAGNRKGFKVNGSFMVEISQNEGFRQHKFIGIRQVDESKKSLYAYTKQRIGSKRKRKIHKVFDNM